ncbi:YfgM family protein [Alteromonas sp. a30]|uniref:YfgM family protein n=1 Tax=Alteromonas sp. a30 TaxID=2730917 RepID=UPI002282DA81|nr:tetratricopeptide repeat protein [Alteromonas sp. a30]MCY7294586.1 tetratricopeptide repeat protein [Alteromonas sp. a30]
MDQFRTEEEQVEAIKKFWKENGAAIVLGAVLGFGGLWGWRYYNAEQLASQEQASNAYESAVRSLGQSQEAFTEVKAFVDENNESSYAVMAALRLAKEAVERGDLSEAQKQLEWVTNSQADIVIKDIALLRLARVQAEQENFSAAQASLNKIVSESYLAQVEEIKGDIYRKQGMFDEAEKAYTAALGSDETNDLLQMKLDDLASQKQG